MQLQRIVKRQNKKYNSIFYVWEDRLMLLLTGEKVRVQAARVYCTCVYVRARVYVRASGVAATSNGEASKSEATKRREHT